MKNTCPKCDTAYNVSAAAIGRKFTCKNCSTPVVVTDEGLDYQNPPTKSPPAKATPPAAPAAAFDFDAGGGDEQEERKPAKGTKPAKAAKPAKRPRDEEEEEKFEDDDYNSSPRRKPKRKGNIVVDFLFFKEFIAPLFVKLIFWLLVLVIVGGGLVFALISVVSGTTAGILTAFGIVFIGIPLYLLLVRVYVELILLGFALYDRLGEIKTLIEKHEPPTP